jgi:endonuclease YncB( thermonuclease family)
MELTTVTKANADPCKAIPDRGPIPSYLHQGARLSGPVIYVGDGDSLCIAVGQGPANWVEIRLADFYAPELHSPAGPAAKAKLKNIAMGRNADCIATHRSYDRMVATCRIDGHSIREMLKASGIVEGGSGYRDTE